MYCRWLGSLNFFYCIVAHLLYGASTPYNTWDSNDKYHYSILLSIHTQAVFGLLSLITYWRTHKQAYKRYNLLTYSVRICPLVARCPALQTLQVDRNRRVFGWWHYSRGLRHIYRGNSTPRHTPRPPAWRTLDSSHKCPWWLLWDNSVYSLFSQCRTADHKEGRSLSPFLCRFQLR